MRKRTLTILFLLTVSTVIMFITEVCNKPASIAEVTVYDRNSDIQTNIEIDKGADGQLYIDILLTNTGKGISRIDSVEVLVLPGETIPDSTSLIFGGSCMGRTPIQQCNAKNAGHKSSTFLLIQHSEKKYTHLGILTWNTFLPYIFYDQGRGIVIKANGEGKPLAPGESIRFEKLVLTESASWQDLMFGHGMEIKKEHQIPEKEIKQFKGWSTWDYYGRVYDTKDVIKNIDRLNKEGFDANLIQIDGGWWTARGDYLSVRGNLQGGLKAIADYARKNGYMPGIHLDGFRADLKSELYKNNPDWFLKDQDGETICYPIDKGDIFMHYIYFDFSNPEVCEYLKNILTVIRKDWGFQYFKIDFIRYGLLESIMFLHGPEADKGLKKVTDIRSFNPDMTSIERTRAGLKAMREGIGDAFFLGCSSVFGPTLGIVDGLRTGGDISPRFEFYETRCLQNGGNFYLNHSVVQNDADYLVLRNKFDEEPERAWAKHKFGSNTSCSEAQMWSNYVALFGGIKISSDNLMILREERKNLIKDAFSYKTANRFLPLDLWDHARDENDAFNIMLAENEEGLFLGLFNWEEKDKYFILSGFPPEAVVSVKNNQQLKVHNQTLEIQMKRHSSMILEIDSCSFDKLRERIRWTY